MGTSLCFCCIENYVLLHKSVYYEVITDYGKLFQYSVFFAVGTILCIDSILYIYIIYIYNIK